MMLQQFITKVQDGQERKANTVLKLSEKYKLYPDPFSWRLEILTETDHPKNKSGYSIEKRYYPKLSYALNYIMDNELKAVDGGWKEVLEALETLRFALLELVKEWETFAR